MRRARGHSFYVDDLKGQRAQKSTGKSFAKLFASAFVAFFIAVFSVQGIWGQDQIAHADDEAGGILCSNNDFGTNMEQNDRGNWRAMLVNYPEDDASGRQFTAQEAFSSNLKFVNYHGEGEGEPVFGFNLLADQIRDFDGDYDGEAPPGYEDKLDQLSDQRSFSTCFMGAAGAELTTVMMTLANLVASVAQFMSIMAFNSYLVCTSDTQDYCFDLAGIIGGDDGGDGGIIGVLTDSLYMPLLIIVGAFVGVWAMIVGFKQLQLRKAFIGIGKAALAVVFGLMFLLNPTMLAQAPMTVATTMSGCIVGAFNGENCFTQDEGQQELEVSTELCESSANGVGADGQMSMTVNSLSCAIWEAFVLEPYAQGSFGMSLSELNTDNEEMSELIDSAGFESEQYNVNMRSTASAQDMDGDTLELDSGSPVSNVAVYQLYLMTDANTGDADAVSSDSLDERWWRIIMLASEDDHMWDAWTSSSYMISMLSIVTSIAGTIIVFVTSFVAVMYYLISIILMALAPLFFLLAVLPGRGWSLFVGWLEQVVSNVLKYIISAVFLIMTIALYGGVLANATENMFLTLLFVLILTGALWMYRSEIINMIGRVRMGGEQMSSKMGDKVKGWGTRSGRFGKATAGGAVGGAAAAGFGGSFKGALGGMKDGAKRDLSRGEGVVGGAAKQAQRITNENKSGASRDTKKAQTDSANAEKTSQSAQSDYSAQLASSQQARESNPEVGNMSKDELQKSSDTKQQVEGNVLVEMKNSGDGDTRDYGEAKSVELQIADVDRQYNEANARGDGDETRRLAGEKKELRDKQKDADAKISDDKRKAMDEKFSKRVDDDLKNKGVDFGDGHQAVLESERMLSASRSRKKNADLDAVEAAAYATKMEELRDGLSDKGKVSAKDRRKMIEEAKSEARGQRQEREKTYDPDSDTTTNDPSDTTTNA